MNLHILSDLKKSLKLPPNTVGESMEIIMNLATLITLILVILLISFSIFGIIRKRKSDKCSSGCAYCPSKDSCGRRR